jgi:hypothetical protein
VGMGLRERCIESLGRRFGRRRGERRIVNCVTAKTGGIERRGLWE